VQNKARNFVAKSENIFLIVRSCVAQDSSLKQILDLQHHHCKKAYLTFYTLIIIVSNKKTTFLQKAVMLTKEMHFLN